MVASFRRRQRGERVEPTSVDLTREGRPRGFRLRCARTDRRRRSSRRRSTRRSATASRRTIELLAIAARAQPGQTPVEHDVRRGGVPRCCAAKEESWRLTTPPSPDVPRPASNAPRTKSSRSFAPSASSHRERDRGTGGDPAGADQRHPAMCLPVAGLRDGGAEAPKLGTLSLIEIGPSAGLNLQWDRYRYVYPTAPAATTWGDPGLDSEANDRTARRASPAVARASARGGVAHGNRRAPDRSRRRRRRDAGCAR